MNRTNKTHHTIHADISVEVTGNEVPEKVHFFEAIAVLALIASIIFAVLFLLFNNVTFLTIAVYAVILAGATCCINAILHPGKPGNSRPPVQGFVGGNN